MLKTYLCLERFHQLALQEMDVWNMLNNLKISALVGYHTKFQFFLQINKCKSCELTKVADARGQLLQLWAKPNHKLLQKRQCSIFYFHPLQSYQVNETEPLKFLKPCCPKTQLLNDRGYKQEKILQARQGLKDLHWIIR